MIRLTPSAFLASRLVVYLSPEPADDLCLLIVVALQIGVVVEGEELGELEAVDLLADGGGDGVDTLVYCLCQGGIPGVEPVSATAFACTPLIHRSSTCVRAPPSALFWWRGC